MKDVRLIPCLQLLEGSLVKTTHFLSPKYIGDPLNTVRIFNELEVDELCFLSIRSTLQKKEPDYNLLQQIADECFTPLSYGGGITSVAQAKQVFRCGFEKVVLNTAAVQRPKLIQELATDFGSQAVVVAIDVKKTILGKYNITTHSATKEGRLTPEQWAGEAVGLGAGEILLTSVNNEGTWRGFDLSLVKKITEAVPVPVIAHGGAGSAAHIAQVAQQTKASGIAVGSFFLYQKKGLGVLVNFPKAIIEKAMASEA